LLTGNWLIFITAGLNNLALLIVNCGGSLAMTADSLKVTFYNFLLNTVQIDSNQNLILRS